ncbi:hypothetical protein Tco_0868150 [Tanacetum coccineum]
MYIKRFLNRKRENRKWLIKALEDGPYVFRNITPTVDSFDDLFDYLSQFEKLVNASRAKKLENSHDPLALVAHTSSSSRNTSSYYVTHPSSVVDYDEEYEQDDVHNHLEDPLASAMNSGNVGRNNRRAFVQEEVVEGMNATNETANVQRIVRTPTPDNTSTGKEAIKMNLVQPYGLMQEFNQLLQNSDDEPSYDSGILQNNKDLLKKSQPTKYDFDQRDEMYKEMNRVL